MDIQKTEIFVYAPGNGALITGIPFMATAFLAGNDSNLLIVFYVQIMPDDFVMQLHPILRTTATSVPVVPGAASDSGYAAQFAAYIAC